MLRTIVWFAYFWGYLLFHLPVLNRGRKALKAGKWDLADAIAYKHVPEWCNTLVKLAGVEITVTGRENVPNRPCVFVANHRSLYDIPIMLTLLKDPMPLVAKIEANKFPIVRRWMELLHCLFLDRANPRQGMEIINQASEIVNKGYHMGIFPEGTRYKGEEGGMGPFLGGAFRIASKSKAPVVPVVIFNSRACLEGDGHFTMKPQKVQVHILPAIETEGMDRAALKALPQQVEEIVRNELKAGTKH
ncbi:MAG: 1-acyl-sn-glycerol-3-phosphate acyltransferase [Oscillospiraceae bacterium]|nr:1-acyl-sn-glycerol-3-phosphate acyltransferase [Oscillospiraceae bacterium]